MGRHGGHPSLKRIAANNALRAIWRAAVPRSRGTNKGPNIGRMPCLGTNKASIDQHGAEGPDALQVLIKDPMILPDLDRGRESAGSPSLRTGQALFTHPALQLMGSNSETEVFEF